MMEIKIAHGDKDIPAYMAKPEYDTGELVPGVVVVFDMLGMSHDVRHQTDWLGSEGYLAVAPDLYYEGRTRCIRNMVLDFARGKGPTYDQMESIRSWVASHPRCNGKVGIIGFCLGGGFALAFAANRGFSAAGANYGRLPRKYEELLKDACPIVGSYGKKDPQLVGAAEKLEKVLAKNNIPHDIKEYPDAGHSFLNDHSEESAIIRVGIKALNLNYHEPSAIDARRRIVDFFNTHLN